MPLPAFLHLLLLTWISGKVIESQHHTEHFNLEGTSGGHITQPSTQSNYFRLFRNLPSLFLDNSKEGDSTSSQDSRHGRYIGDTNVTSRLELISNYVVFGTRQKSSVPLFPKTASEFFELCFTASGTDLC